MKKMPSFVLQIVSLAVLLALFGMTVIKRKAKKSEYEVTYKHQLIESAVYDLENNAIIITDAANKVLLWNKGAEKLFGWKEDEVVKHNLNDLIHANLPEVILKNTPIDTEAMHRLQSMIPVSLTVSESKVGKVLHYTAIIKNIRTRKEFELQQQRELELLNEGEELGCFGSWSWAINTPDMLTDRVMVTDGFNRIFETDDLVTDVQFLMDRVWHEDAARVFAVLKKAQDEKSDYKIEYRIQKKNGKLIWIHCVGKMYLTAAGNIEKIVGTIQQIKKETT